MKVEKDMIASITVSLIVMTLVMMFVETKIMWAILSVSTDWIWCWNYVSDIVSINRLSDAENYVSNIVNINRLSDTENYVSDIALT
jgi:hypothetical protein